MPSMSAARLRQYVARCGHNYDRALATYIWNAKMGEAFHTPIQAAEVALRNCVNLALIKAHGSDWWKETAFLGALDRERKQDLDTVFQRIENRDITLCTDQVVAGLSLGYWVGMLSPRYNQTIWSAQFAKAFPKAPPGVTRGQVWDGAKQMAELRNRISHHEPIFQRDLSADYKVIFDLVIWASPDKAKWIKPHCAVMALMRTKP